MKESQALAAYKKIHYDLVDIPAEEWEYLETNIITFKEFSKGSYFCRQGEYTNKIAFLADGLFEGIHVVESGKEYIHKFYTNNSLLSPYDAILNKSPSDISVKALEDSCVIELTIESIQELYSRHECWQIVGRKFGEMLYLNKSNNEKELQRQTPEKRYLNFINNYKGIADRVSDRKIALYLGINYVTLSRLKKKILNTP